MKLALTLLTLGLTGIAVLNGAPPPKKKAAPAPARREPPSFRVADKNNDGRVGPDEFAVADPGKGAFNRWDKNKNGFLSPNEYADFLAANRGPGGPRP